VAATLFVTTNARLNPKSSRFVTLFSKTELARLFSRHLAHATIYSDSNGNKTMKPVRSAALALKPYHNRSQPACLGYQVFGTTTRWAKRCDF
jgi:hypothetical protein